MCSVVVGASSRAAFGYDPAVLFLMRIRAHRKAYRERASRQVRGTPVIRLGIHSMAEYPD